MLSKWLKPKSGSSLDCLMCADFARQPWFVMRKQSAKPVIHHSKVDARLPEKENANSHGARPVY